MEELRRIRWAMRTLLARHLAPMVELPGPGTCVGIHSTRSLAPSLIGAVSRQKPSMDPWICVSAGLAVQHSLPISHWPIAGSSPEGSVTFPLGSTKQTSRSLR